MQAAVMNSLHAGSAFEHNKALYQSAVACPAGQFDVVCTITKLFLGCKAQHNEKELLKTKLEAKHEQYIVAGQTAQRLEKEHDAAKDWAERETLKALQQRQQRHMQDH